VAIRRDTDSNALLPGSGTLQEPGRDELSGIALSRGYSSGQARRAVRTSGTYGPVYLNTQSARFRAVSPRRRTASTRREHPSGYVSPARTGQAPIPR